MHCARAPLIAMQRALHAVNRRGKQITSDIPAAVVVVVAAAAA